VNEIEHHGMLKAAAVLILLPISEFTVGLLVNAVAGPVLQNPERI
jgi:hypothetical protein